MPIRMVREDGKKDLIPRYYAPMLAQPGAPGLEAVRAYRRSAVADREFFEKLRKVPEAARYASAEVKRHQRRERAATIVIRWAEELGANSIASWPVELAEELDEVAGVLYLAEAA